jgi:hypothetical protein
MSRDARPYLVPGTVEVVWSAWERLVGDSWTQLGDKIEGWDPEMDVIVRRTVEADWSAFRRGAGLPADFPLFVSAKWESSSSQMRARLGTVAVPTAGPVSLQGTIPGQRAGGTLEIATAISTAADWASAPPGVAARAGSAFANDAVRIVLEGSGSMFPVALVDFSHTRFDPDASWHLSTPEDLTAPFLGSVILSLNERDRELVAALSALKPNPEQRALLLEVQQRVAMTMLETALDAERSESLLTVAWPVESVGDVLRRLLESASGTVPSERADVRAWLDGASRRAAQARAFE